MQNEEPVVCSFSLNVSTIAYEAIQNMLCMLSEEPLRSSSFLQLDHHFHQSVQQMPFHLHCFFLFMSKRKPRMERALRLECYKWLLQWILNSRNAQEEQ